ncbi:TerB family tellurite resistance protein [Paracoccus sp. SSJ]|uniref:TerB family tellurite resistance protein n=1 Tax=Paracoccus sp. SSJ TaxID=3050636 RepID=UPI00255165FF|nr:TerB family tellurite resistance protein [Paracoccus sp. SSJ]MDK8872181.1 TerB family tellurite resistance protein [Paracoccus sp. SSJ]
MTTEQDQIGEFDDVKRVIANDLKFKARLGIREDAFASVKLGKTIGSLSEVGGAAATGAGIAQSGMVASTFFAKSGLMAALGIGGAAATPVGWVIAAALASGGAYYGVTRLFKGYEDSRVDVVPRFLNTPIDLLGASMLDLMGSLSLKVAAMDGQVDPREVAVIRDYFVDDWGYDADYVDHALSVLQANADKSRLAEMTQALAEFVHANPDCKFTAIQQEIKVLLHEIAQADGKLDEREDMAIERILRALDEQNSIRASIGRAASGTVAAASSAAGWIGSRFGLGKT